MCIVAALTLPHLFSILCRKLVGACDRVKNGLKKLLETNELVDKMQVKSRCAYS